LLKRRPDIREAEARVAALRRHYGAKWSREYEETDGGDERLARDALALLLAFGLAAQREGGLVARPAAARFAPEP
jgi:hypothetical protein